MHYHIEEKNIGGPLVWPAKAPFKAFLPRKPKKLTPTRVFTRKDLMVRKDLCPKRVC